MKFVIDISEHDKEWIGNAYGIPQDINTKIAEAIINADTIQPKRIRGQWSIKGQAIDTVRGYWAKCSTCGHAVFGGGNYCSYCGSYNKGEVIT